MTAPVRVTPHSHGGGVPESTRAAALASYDVADFPVPTGREEDWRFTPLARLRGLHDGTYPELAHTSDRPGLGVVIEPDLAPEARLELVGRDDPRIGAAYTPTDRVSAQAFTAFEKATVLTVPREAVASRPSVLTVRGEGGVSFGHLVIDVEPFARATVVLDHVGSATYAANVEFRVGDGAALKVVSLQDWAADSVHLAHHHARLGRDARYRAVTVSFGGEVVRLRESVAYEAPGGDAELRGVYFADAGQHLEHRLFIDHAVPHCRSNVSYKGALQGQDAHTVWIGDVLIRAEAEGTDTYEINRNLVLTDGARADSVPNLEIETGEIIGAGHASATGRFDDEQLFYLQARGIPVEEARRLVVRGFFADIFQHINIDRVEARLVAHLEDELEGHFEPGSPADRVGGAA